MIRRLIVVAAMCGVFAAVAHAQVPQTLGYQGFLANASGSAVVDGTYSVTFRLYDVATGGTALWSETQTVSTARGVFTVALGASTTLSLAFDKAYWLGISVGGGAELSPRVPLATSAYAFIAKSVENNTVTSARIADATIATADVADGAVTSAKIAEGTVATANLADGSVIRPIRPSKIEGAAGW